MFVLQVYTATGPDYFLKHRPTGPLHSKQIKTLTVSDRLFLKKTRTCEVHFNSGGCFVMKCCNLLSAVPLSLPPVCVLLHFPEGPLKSPESRVWTCFYLLRAVHDHSKVS